MRLIGYESRGGRLPGSTYWKIPLSSILALEERRVESDCHAVGWSAISTRWGILAESAPSSRPEGMTK